VAIEIERRFLVKPEAWQQVQQRLHGKGVEVTQGYLCMGENVVVRVRIAADRAWITFKSRIALATRYEFEYSIPVSDARQILQTMCGPYIIHKTRYRVCPDDAGCWEVDVFHEQNDGLVIAEHELSHPHQFLILPAWVGQEITHDSRYDNMNLAKNPFKSWPDAASY
jgi:adenylate cyclase